MESPSRITEPLPNCFSIWLSAAERAFLRFSSIRSSCRGVSGAPPWDDGVSARIISQITGGGSRCFRAEMQGFTRAPALQRPVPQRLVMHVAMHRHGFHERERFDAPAHRRNRLAFDGARTPRERQMRAVDARLALETCALEAAPQLLLERRQRRWNGSRPEPPHARRRKEAAHVELEL